MIDRPSLVERIRKLLAAIPPHVEVLAAAKTRTPDEVRAAIDAGIRLIGQNYVQEATAAIETIGRDAAQWNLIGHLQRNKAKLAVRLFDAIETVDSVRLAAAIDREAAKIDTVLPILIEINSAREDQKSGVVPEDAEAVIREIAAFSSIQIDGLMTMGPFVPDPEEIRPYFAETRRLFDRIAALGIPNVEMHTLSMGMSDSYRVAIDEGATRVRLGTVLFGPRST